MIGIGEKMPEFNLVSVKPGFNEPEESGESAFESFSDSSFDGKWKVIYFYPMDFTFICPTEIIEFASINEELEKRDCILIGGSTDNEFCKLAWRREHPGLSKLNHRSFADPQGKLTSELGLMSEEGVAYRATMIVDPDNIVQHICVNALDTGRNPIETLRTLEALQAGGLTACNWKPGQELSLIHI